MQSPVETTVGGSTYEFKLRILGNEVLAVGLTSSSSDNRWVALSLLSLFCVITIIGAYGDKLVTLYKHIIT